MVKNLSSAVNLEMKASRLLGAKDYVGALEQYKTLFETKRSNDISVLRNMAYCYERMGEYDSAIQFIEQALNIDPNNFDILKVASGAYLKKDDHAKVYRCVKKALNNAPKELILPWYVKVIFKVASIHPRLREAGNVDKEISKIDSDWLKWAKEYVIWYERKGV